MELHVWEGIEAGTAINAVCRWVHFQLSLVPVKVKVGATYPKRTMYSKAVLRNVYIKLINGCAAGI